MHLVIRLEAFRRQCFVRNVPTPSIDMKCIFSAINAAISLILFQKYRSEIPRHTNVVLDPIFKTQRSKYWRILLLCKIVASWPPFSQEWKKYPTTRMHCGASAERLNVYCPSSIFLFVDWSKPYHVPVHKMSS